MTTFSAGLSLSTLTMTALLKTHSLICLFQNTSNDSPQTLQVFFFFLKWRNLHLLHSTPLVVLCPWSHYGLWFLKFLGWYARQPTRWKSKSCPMARQFFYPSSCSVCSARPSGPGIGRRWFAARTTRRNSGICRKVSQPRLGFSPEVGPCWSQRLYGSWCWGDGKGRSGSTAFSLFCICPKSPRRQGNSPKAPSRPFWPSQSKAPHTSLQWWTHFAYKYFSLFKEKKLTQGLDSQNYCPQTPARARPSEARDSNFHHAYLALAYVGPYCYTCPYYLH